MKWEEIGKQPCSIARTLSVIGDRWTLLILRNAFLGIRRFEEFQKSLGVTRHLLTERLINLVDAEILVKVPYTASNKRFEYKLTEKGLDLYPILMSMAQWGNTWMDQGHGAPIDYIHKECGHVFKPVLVCSHCKIPLRAKHVQPVPGKGFVPVISRTGT
ncbi:winged helix-turn-helix transcriptional regulator [Acinetobacter soli]|uniref:Helix-turn-helix domain-containing protein n=1 Tax=Acinetobacter soli TaxID=487316 RepID=A0AB38YU28_9GAMM|nr:helix-turn-helix domain-containing protein [Acinetobacter soli]KQC98331.1 HxlR family transcriptional regulator [Acinetobacter soli]MDQ8942669.1 helix-turn-helix domain-containing protein [Acinetobacter soli]WEH92795.1 helix-turn-helix domain-containing protein [Acinetobacter soli]WEH98021.1 helix-turn-helix domain-containing protein [Acinetobacter soli]WEI01402.1 helix-turn-helix domain-containing protein [Acinetobacter soli]